MKKEDIEEEIVDLTPEQERIDTLFVEKHNEYESIRKLYKDDETTKLYMMNLFYINNLKEIYECLKDNAGVKLINVDRFSRNDGTNNFMYVPSYINKEGQTKISTTGYPYKAAALMKLFYGFISYLKNEKLE